GGVLAPRRRAFDGAWDRLRPARRRALRRARARPAHSPAARVHAGAPDLGRRRRLIRSLAGGGDPRAPDHLRARAPALLPGTLRPAPALPRPGDRARGRGAGARARIDASPYSAPRGRRET